MKIPSLDYWLEFQHHSYRSYQGITCLMQISTFTKDYLVDTLALRSELYRMNEVFTDPNIIKVLVVETRSPWVGFG